MKRNSALARLSGNYLFHEIALRKAAYLEQHPDADLINCGIGDTTLPLPKVIADALADAALALSTTEGYSGYGPSEGIFELREAIAATYQNISAGEVFISDGAKSDTGRLQMLLGPVDTVAVQDPAYPVYVDGSLINGAKEIIEVPCTPENNFFPAEWPASDVIYVCSPNNPTGTVATFEQLKLLVDSARKNRSLIIFDAAYSAFVQRGPKSIYEIEGAKEVAIEINSFSKAAGFTGVRLGWTVVPKELKYSDGTSIYEDWIRVVSTTFNGASNIVQRGGLSLFTRQGQQAMQKLINTYLTNAHSLRSALEEQGYTVYGGTEAPFLWVKVKDSWGTFQTLLEKHQIVTTPGAGFGTAGEGFVRFSAFELRSAEAASRL